MSFHHANHHNNNVGIINFYKNKTFFITGSTGFTGKVFVEKILRALPSIHKIYLLVRANNSEAAKQRIKNEIIDSKLFKVIREKHGQSYEEFMWNKLVPIAGDLCKPYLGMDTGLAGLIQTEVDVIVHLSSNTKWHDRYDVIFESNVKAVSRLIDFALDCMKLTLFIQLSSAYANLDFSGVAFETPIDLGRYVTEGERNLGLSIEYIVNIEMELISEVARRFHGEEQDLEMIKLSLRRSKFYKTFNCYVLTKAIGETIATKLAEKCPVVIVRPTLIESTIKEPFPGWIEGYKSLDSIILSYGTGQLAGFYANPNTILDLVPVDMLTNAMIAAMAKHANEGKLGVKIYNVTSSSLLNPISCHDLFNFSTNYFTKNPLKDSNNKDILVKDMKFYESMNEFTMVGVNNSTTRNNSKLQSMLLRMAILYEPVLNNTGAWFDDKNTRNLLGEMSLQELDTFNFNFKCINWENYFTKIHIPGLTQHVLKKNSLPSKL